MFERGLAYRTINVHRFAISAYHEPLHGFPIGQSPLVCSLLSGIFSHRPPQPKLHSFRMLKNPLLFEIITSTQGFVG